MATSEPVEKSCKKPPDHTAEPRSQQSETGVDMRHWEPGTLRGIELRRWAASVALLETHQRLAAANNAIQLADSIACGVCYAMDCSPQKCEQECGPGCSTCCHAKIATTPLEAFYVADYLRQNVPDDQLKETRDRVAEVTSQNRGKNIEAWYSSKIACALLDGDGCCMVYPARPIRCRGWCSLSEDRCSAAWKSGSAAVTIPLDSHSYIVGEGVAAGISQGVSDLGLDGTFYELHSALLVALEAPDAIGRWSRGEQDVFGNCDRFDQQLSDV